MVLDYIISQNKAKTLRKWQEEVESMVSGAEVLSNMEARVRHTRSAVAWSRWRETVHDIEAGDTMMQDSEAQWCYNSARKAWATWRQSVDHSTRWDKTLHDVMLQWQDMALLISWSRWRERTETAAVTLAQEKVVAAVRAGVAACHILSALTQWRGQARSTQLAGNAEAFGTAAASQIAARTVWLRWSCTALEGYDKNLAWCMATVPHPKTVVTGAGRKRHCEQPGFDRDIAMMKATQYWVEVQQACTFYGWISVLESQLWQANLMQQAVQWNEQRPRQSKRPQPQVHTVRDACAAWRDRARQTRRCAFVRQHMQINKDSGRPHSEETTHDDTGGVQEGKGTIDYQLLQMIGLCGPPVLPSQPLHGSNLHPGTKQAASTTQYEAVSALDATHRGYQLSPGSRVPEAGLGSNLEIHNAVGFSEAEEDLLAKWS